MTRSDLHPPAFGVTVVVVGLAIREALIRVIPSATSPDSSQGAIPDWQMALEGFRVALFLVVLIRFYLGSVSYFHEVYFSTVNSKRYGRTNYWLDYFLGFVHFMLFFAWATTVNSNERNHTGGASHYLGLGSLVLLYDAVWLAASFNLSTFKKVKFWTLLNVVTFIVSASIFFTAKEVTAFDAVMREQLAMIPLAIVSVLDLAEIFNERPYIANALKRLFSRDSDSDQNEPPPSDLSRSHSAAV
jgi:hypothetical protein